MFEEKEDDVDMNRNKEGPGGAEDPGCISGLSIRWDLEQHFEPDRTGVSVVTGAFWLLEAL